MREKGAYSLTGLDISAIVSCALRHPLPESTARTFHEGGSQKSVCRAETLGPNGSPNTQHGVDGFDAAKCASRAAGV